MSSATDVDLPGLCEAMQVWRIALPFVGDHPLTAELSHEIERQARAAMASQNSQPAPAPAARAEGERKKWATLQARAALAGFYAVLTDTDDGRPQLVCSRWSLTRAFDNLPELEAWLQRVTGRAA